MTTNEVLTRHNFVSKLLLKDGDKELSRDLKVKVMGMRIEYGKIRKQFDEDVQEFVKGLNSDRLTELQQKGDRTEAEEKELQELTDKLNGDYRAYVDSRLKEDVAVSDKKFTEDDYAELVEVNAGNDVEINGTKLQATDFLEILYTLFFDE
jgi:hypothetical protein